MARLMRSTEIIIIGGGPGGYEVAAELAATGHKVVLIERDRLGGTCLNRGCIPTKCLCASASTAMTVASAAEFGVDVGSVKVDFGRAVERANGVMNQLR
ncbi:MAG: FAD-dependent oxidoreductase, partial [Muribaculaceae bacterium]|nr:FAD-dependent oxidoreductase [Muribaculaceae bacterium]